MVYVGHAIGIDPGQQGRHIGQLGNVLPGQDNARRLGHGDQMQGVVGRAAGRQKGHSRIDQGLDPNDLVEWRIVAAERADLHRTMRGGAGQGGAQGRVWRDKGRARQVQAHGLHQHLVGIGGAIKGASARCVIGLGFRFQQFSAASLASSIALAHLGLVWIWQTRRHGPCGHKNRTELAKPSGRDEQARHDLVTDAQIERRIKQVVRQANRR